jgi:outer membrane protein assembly factor BamB
MFLKTCFIVLIVFFSLIVIFPSTEVIASSPWPMFLHDARHTGRSPYVIGDSVKRLWTSGFDRAFSPMGIRGLVVGSDGTIYAGDLDHYLYALNPHDGSVKWEFLTEHELVGSPALDSNGNIYIGTRSGHVLVLMANLNGDIRLFLK